MCAFPCACLSGHWSRCGYCTISTIGLGSIASPALLPAHHSVTPCHSPGVQKVMMSFPSQGCPQGSWNSATVSRNPSGLVLEWNHRQIRAQLLCYVWACMCIFPPCVWNHVIYKTGMTKPVNVTGETISFTRHWNQPQTLRRTLRIRRHISSSLHRQILPAHMLLNSLWGASSFTAKSISVTLLNLSVGSGGCIAE